jgi:hypothetical protein
LPDFAAGAAGAAAAGRGVPGLEAVELTTPALAMADPGAKAERSGATLATGSGGLGAVDGVGSGVDDSSAGALVELATSTSPRRVAASRTAR